MRLKFPKEIQKNKEKHIRVFRYKRVGTFVSTLFIVLLDKLRGNLYNVLACMRVRIFKNTTGGENNANIQPVSKKRTSDS